MKTVRIGIIFCIAFLVLVTSSCNLSERKRPFGYVRLGNIKNYLASETYVRDHNLLIRRDNRGLYAMSTMCTYDLTSLKLKRTGKVLKLHSTFTTSRYDALGRVISGPAKVNLPYFEIKIAPKVAGDPPNTLYARVGDEVAPNWRLPLK